MSRATLILYGPDVRARAVDWVARAAPGTRVDFKGPKRTLPQNARLWAMLTDVAQQVVWHGQKLRPDDWKLVFMAALKTEMRLVPAIDGRGFVNIGTSSSDLSKAEFGALMEIIAAFGAQHGVVFHDGQSEAA